MPVTSLTQQDIFQTLGQPQLDFGQSLCQLKRKRAAHALCSDQHSESFAKQSNTFVSHFVQQCKFIAKRKDSKTIKMGRCFEQLIVDSYHNKSKCFSVQLEISIIWDYITF